jgi:hypothetical protein
MARGVNWKNSAVAHPSAPLHQCFRLGFGKKVRDFAGWIVTNRCYGRHQVGIDLLAAELPDNGA